RRARPFLAADRVAAAAFANSDRASAEPRADAARRATEGNHAPAKSATGFKNAAGAGRRIFALSGIPRRLRLRRDESSRGRIFRKTNSGDASGLHQAGGTTARPLADRAELPAPIARAGKHCLENCEIEG